MLVVFFGYPIFMFMIMRMFLSMDTMRTTGQLVCNAGFLEDELLAEKDNPLVGPFGVGPIGIAFENLDN